jgi:hypothetical protein
MATIRELLVKINGDNSGLNNALIKTGQDLKAIEDNAKKTALAFTDFGKKMTMAVSLPLAALGTYMVIAATDSEKAMALLANSIKAVGNEGKVSVKVLADYADELQHTTKWDDEVTMGAMRMLESLTGLNEKGIKAIIPSIQDFASAWGMDLEQAASLVGKTIASNTNALGRYGIQVDSAASQSEKFASVLQGLARYQGTATTEGKTFAGQLQILKNEAEELASEFGKEMMPMLTDLVKSLRGLVEQFSQMPEGTKRAILAAMAFAAAIGPASSAIGGMIQSFIMLKGVFKLAGGPAGWIMLAVAALVAIGVAIGTNIQKQKEYDAVMAGTSKKAAEEQIRIVKEQLQAAKDYYAQVTAGQEKWSKTEQKNQRTIVESSKKDIDAYQARLDMLYVLQREQEAFAGTSSESTADQVKLLTDGTVRIANEKAAIDKKIAEMKKLINPEVAAALGESTAMKKLQTQLANINAELEKYKERIDNLKSGKTKPSDDGLGLQGAAEAIEDTTVKWLGFNNATELADVMMKNAARASNNVSVAVEETNLRVEDFVETYDVYLDRAREGLKIMSLQEIADAQWARDLAETQAFMKDQLIPTMGQVFEAINYVTNAIAGQGSEMAQVIKIQTDWVSGFAKIASGDWLGGTIQMIKALTDAINKNKKAAEEAAKTTVDYMESTKTAEAGVVGLSGKIAALNDKYANMNWFEKFFMGADNRSKVDAAVAELAQAMEELSAKYADSVGQTLGDALINGMSKVNFMAAIGKILINAMIAASLAAGPLAAQMAAIGEKISAWVIGGYSEAGAAEIEAMASSLYDTFSSNVLPVIQRVQAIFGTGEKAATTEAATPDPVSSFASGVRNFSGGIARVGEQGPEIIRAPRGTNIDSSSARQIGGSTFNFNSPRELSPLEQKRRYQVMTRQLAWEGNL